MGVRRALQYQGFLCVPLIAVWYVTTCTRSAPYSPLPVLAVPDASPFPFAQSTSIHLFLYFDSQTEGSTAALESDLTLFVNQLSQFADVRMTIQTGFIEKVCCESCKMDSFSPYLSPINLSERGEQILIFGIVTNKECERIPGENVVYARKGTVGIIATYVVEIVRRKFGLRVDSGMDLINGFTSEELKTFPSSLHSRLKAYVSSRAELLNTLIATNSPAIPMHSYEQIKYVQSLLTARSDYSALLHAARLLEQLLQQPELYHEEYFQMDFKVGVYAPLFVPPVFPLLGVAHSLWTRRRHR